MGTTLEVVDLLRVLPVAAVLLGVLRVVVRGLRAEEVVAEKHEMNLRRVREVSQSAGYWPKVAGLLVLLSSSTKPPSGDSAKWTDDQRSAYQSNILRNLKFQLSTFAPTLDAIALDVASIDSAKRYGAELKVSFEAQAIAVAVGAIPSMYVAVALFWPDSIDWVSFEHWWSTLAIVLVSSSATAFLVFWAREIRIGRDIARALSGLPDIPAGVTS